MPTEVSPGSTAVPPEPPPAPAFQRSFAVVAAVVLVLAVGALLFLASVFDDQLGLGAREWRDLGGEGQLAAQVLKPLLGLGGLVLAVGLWMALVEWRGGFARSSGAAQKGFNVGEVVEAVGKLRGAALVLVVGASLLLGAAWVASSAIAPAPAADEAPTAKRTPPRATPSPEASASPTPAPG